VRVLIAGYGEDVSRFDMSEWDLFYTFHHQDDLSWAAELPFDECLITSTVPNLPGFLDLLLGLKESSRSFGGAIAVEDAFTNMYHPITAL
jgi:hypothetical protein